MKAQNLLLIGTVLLSIVVLPGLASAAANNAPSSLGGTIFTVTAGNGSTPFSNSGTWRLFSQAAGTNYTTLGTTALSSGSCQFTFGTNSIVSATLADATGGPAIAMQLVFASPTNGTIAITNGNAFQTGVFRLATYVNVDPPQVFLPSLTNNQFQASLGGQPGFNYGVDISSSLPTWQSWSNFSLSDLTTNIVDTSAQEARFYRARFIATAFAPDNLTNQTLNLSITEGKPPLATNGIAQWLASTNDSSYQVLGGPGTANSTGNYSYSRTGPDTGLISSQDSVAGTIYEQLVFTSPNNGYFYATNSTGTQSGTFTMADGPVQFFGNLQFTPDPSRSHSLYYDASGNPATLSVTNTSGWIWTLTFPSNALLTPRTITMTPLTNLNAVNMILPVSDGVRLEPDGIQFSAPVTLSAKPPVVLGAHAALLTTADDGTSIFLVPTTNESGVYSTTLLHFTSGAATDPSDNTISALIDKAQAAYQNAVKQVQGLKRVIVTPPEPPDYDWKCDGNPGADAQIDAYQKALFAKESDALQRLLSAAKSLELLGVQPTPNEFTTALGLIETAMFRKVDTLFSQYSGDPKKCAAVTRIALNVMRQDELLGGSGRPDWFQQIQSWLSRVEDYYWTELRDKHMYSKATVLVQVLRSIALLGGNVDMGDFVDKLNKATVFTLTLDINLTHKDWDSEGTLNNSVAEEVYGSAKLQAGTTKPFPVSTNSLKFISGTWADPVDICSYSLDGGQSSTWRMSLGLQVCGEPRQAILALPSPGPPLETWTGCEEVSMPSPWLGIVYGTAFVCQPINYNGAGGLYLFPLVDGEANVVNETINGDSATGMCADPLQSDKASILLILQHTPQ